MTNEHKNEILSRIFELITELAHDKDAAETIAPPAAAPIEMLTVKECTEVVPGLSEHSVRKLIAQGKVKFIRTGEGKRGKFLINKDSLIDYLQK